MKIQTQIGIKVLIIFNNDEGIDCITKPDSSVINANGRKKLAIDYDTEYNKEEDFVVKLKNGSLVTNKLNITQEDVNNQFEINIIKNEDKSYNVVDYVDKQDEDKNFYKIGTDSWENYNINNLLIAYSEISENLTDENEGIIDVDLKKVDKMGNTVYAHKKSKVHGSNIVILTRADGTKLKLSASALKNADGTINTEALQSIYGTKVKYAQDTDSDIIKNRVWRIFYIDFDNRYGDGAGTIYLKADELKETDEYEEKAIYLVEDYTENSLDLTNSNVNLRNKLWQMNPAYAKVCNNVFQTGNDNAKAVAYLDDPAKWTAYVNSSANYAIGAPSIEMFCDSISVFKPDFARGSSTTNASTLNKGWTYCNTTGYIEVNYRNRAYFWQTDTYTEGTVDDMYCNGNDSGWIGSPSGFRGSMIMTFNGSIGNSSGSDGHGYRSFYPIVALKAKVQ